MYLLALSAGLMVVIPKIKAEQNRKQLPDGLSSGGIM